MKPSAPIMQMVRGAAGLPSRSRWTAAGEDEGNGEVRIAAPANPNKMNMMIFFFKTNIHLTIVVKSYTLTILFKIFFV